MIGGNAGVTADAGRERLVPLGLAALALVLIVMAIGPYPVGVFQDDGMYTVLARSLATGEGYRFTNLPGAPNATHFPPLYPVFLAGLWKLFPAFPANVTLFKFANAVLVALAAWFGWQFARRQLRMDRWAAGLAVGGFTAGAPVVFLGVMVMSEPLFLAALFPVLVACERAAASGSRRDAVVAGLAGGCLALIRTLGVVAIPATALVLAWRRRWLAAALVMVAGVAVLLPWQLWVSAHAGEVPAVFAGKYGSYSGWMAEGIRAGGIRFVFSLVRVNVSQVLSLGWETFGVNLMAIQLRISVTILVTVLFALGWWRVLRSAPVAAWALAMYLALVMAWPFTPARFMWAVWPLIGMTFGLAVDGMFTWRPAGNLRISARRAGLAAASLLTIGYVRYNYEGVAGGWWARVQSGVADRARPLAEWVVANTPNDAVIATDDDVMIHLYTGRRAVPNGTFTPQEHVTPQTPSFAAETLREIIREYDVDYVLASSEYGAYAARGLIQAQPPELAIVGALKVGAIFRPIPRGGLE